MASFSELFDRQNLTQKLGTSNSLVQRRADQLQSQTHNHLIDPLVDRMWAGYDSTDAPNSYFDYFFAGQDIKVYVDGTDDAPEFQTLPIAQMAFNVSQQKTPIYGFWSYTYDAVLRGVRLIEGQFTLVTKSPDYMRRLLEKAAETRANRVANYSYFRGLTEDDENIEKYWGQNIDPAVTSAGKNLFSVHPPFSFIIVYGVQNMSLSGMTPQGWEDFFVKYQEDTPLMTDTNERLVESDPQDQANRIILDACELTSMSTAYTTDGSVVVENYSFFARDIILPPRAQYTNSAPSVPVPTGGARGTVVRRF